MDLSVIIVSWNTKNLLLDCLRSLTSQITLDRNEIVVVDNGSHDGSPDAVRTQFPHVTLIRSDVNRGFSAANNLGLEKSAGRYVILVNPDVLVSPGSLQLMKAYMDENPSVGLLGPRVLNPDGTLQLSCTRRPTVWNAFARAIGLDNLIPGLTYFPHDRSRDVEVLSGCLLMARRKAIHTVGVLDERYFMYAEDKDWCTRFNAAGWKVVYYPRAEIIHFGGSSSSLVPVKSYIQMLDSNVKYWRKHFPRRSQAAYYCILWLHHSLRLCAWSALTLLHHGSKSRFRHKIDRTRASIRWLWNMALP
jgi:GT2 family glycosyltransferase